MRIILICVSQSHLQLNDLGSILFRLVKDGFDNVTTLQRVIRVVLVGLPTHEGERPRFIASEPIQEHLLDLVQDEEVPMPASQPSPVPETFSVIPSDSGI